VVSLLALFLVWGLTYFEPDKNSDYLFWTIFVALRSLMTPVFTLSFIPTLVQFDKTIEALRLLHNDFESDTRIFSKTLNDFLRRNDYPEMFKTSYAAVNALSEKERNLLIQSTALSKKEA